MKAIMYHYVRPEDKNYPYFTFLHINDFKKQLDYFQDNFTIIHPSEIKQKIGNVANAMVLTFDDGVKDHYQYVLPELQKRNISGVFYISTGVHKTKKLLDVHRLHILLGKYGGKVIYNHLLTLVSNDMLTDENREEFRVLTYKTQENDDATLAVKRMMNYFISYSFREAIMDELMLNFFEDEAAIYSNYYLSTDEIKKMHDAGMVIGSHTVNHPLMSKLPTESQLFEINESFNFLEQATGGLSFKTFCYPYGGFHSFTATTEELLQAANCAYSFNVEQRDITLNDLTIRPQALPRYDCNYFPYGKIWVSEN